MEDSWGIIVITFGIWFAWITTRKKEDNFNEIRPKSKEEEFLKIQSNCNSDEEVVFTVYRNKEIEFVERVYGKNNERELQSLEDRINTEFELIVGNDCKGRLIFHGGCLDCEAPINNGITSCIGCQYFMFDMNLQNKFVKEQ